MRLSESLFALLLSAPGVFAQSRAVAITVDDLPYAAGGVSAVKSQAAIVNRKLLGSFRKRKIPVTGFSIQKQVEELGPIGVSLLKLWIQAGFDLGNHTYSHGDINNLSTESIEDEIVRGESAIAPLMNQARKRLEFFRFPFNHTGDSKTKHDAIAEFLARRGYRVAVCTIDTSDYVFNQAYVRILANHDDAKARRLRGEYLAYSSAEIDYYAGLNERVLGYEPAEIMLLHDNRLNGDSIGGVLDLFEKKGYKFVTLNQALSDNAYRAPDEFITRFGPMWGYRWAAERNLKVDGRLEPEPPAWVREYGDLK